MSTKLFVLALLVCSSLTSGTAGTLNILPLSPKAGGTVTLEYTPGPADASLIATGKVHAALYAFTIDAESPRATEVTLSKKGNAWVGTTTVDASTVYTIVKVGNGRSYDTNKELYWEFLTASDKGTPVRGAHMRAAFARYGQMPAPCRMKEDFTDAIEELDKETRAYPNNVVARVNYVIVMKNTGGMDEAEATAKMREVTTSVMQAQTAMDAIALAQAYESQGRQDESQRVMIDAASRFPKSIVAEQTALSQLGSAPTIDAFIDRAAEHLAAWPESFARQNLIDAVVKNATQQNALRALIRFLDRTQGIPAMSYHQAVNYIGANDTLRSEALRLIDVGMAAAKDPARRPAYIGPSEWAEEQRIATSELMFVRGAIHRAQRETDQAITWLERSIEVGGNEAEKNCYDMLIGLYRDKQENAKAIATAERALSSGAGTQGVIDAYRLLLAEEGLDSAAIAKREQSVRDKGRSVLADRITREMLNQPAIDGTFTTLEGVPVNIADWKGKVVILDYWATWCGPCRQSFPSLQKLYERYKNNPNVVFAIVNVWERSNDRPKLVRDFLAQNKNLTFPMYLDTDDSVVGKFGVTGIPTKFYIGRDGRIQFKEVGATPEEQFLEEATNRIEVLLSK
jgi:thiol-disulfide isomerase/thioredoxin/tetratricopeptide (TPR) repeat protein